MQIIDAASREDWDTFIISHKESNFLQSWDFYDFHASRGNQIIRRIILDTDSQIIAAYAGVIETAKRGRYLAIAGGPILDWGNKKLVKLVFDDIRSQAATHHCVFARVRPQLELSDQSLTLMHSLDAIKSPMYLSAEYVGILDITQPEESILTNASQGFRRKLRKAEKNNITIETSTDPAIVHTFYQLEVEHAKRQGFVAFSESFLTKQFTAFANNNEAIMYIARKDGEILAMNFMIFYGSECSYHYGVSSPLGNQYSAAPLLHLEAMREARNRGIPRYNLWGIVGPNETSHRFYGVSEFKRSFGCTELKYTPAHDIVINKPKYLLTKAIESTRAKLRHV